MAKKKSSVSSARAKPARKSTRAIHDSKIDYSDIPPLSDAQLKAMKPFGRPLLGSAPRQMIAVRLDPVVLEKLKKEAKRTGKPYQGLINEVLASFVKKVA